MILDNLSVHKSPKIEQVFAKFKQILRYASKRTVDELWDFIASIILNIFSPEECFNYFVNSAYKVS